MKTISHKTSNRMCQSLSRSSVNKSHIKSRSTDWNSHLAFEAAILSPYAVNLTGVLNRDIQGIIPLLMQNYDKFVARRFLVRIYTMTHKFSNFQFIFEMQISIKKK